MLKHLFASFCLKYLVPTISVISVTDLWSVIRIYKKRSIETLLRSFNMCQARPLLHGAVTWFCTKFEYNTTKSGFWGKDSFIQRHLRTLYSSFNSYNFWHFLRVMQKHCWPEVHKLQNRARHYNLAKPWLNTCLERHLRHGHLRDISINFQSDLYGKKIISDNQSAKHIYPF